MSTPPHRCLWYIFYVVLFSAFRTKKCGTGTKMTFTTVTRSSSAAITVAATNAIFLKPSVKRIMKGSICIILGITKESIKCAGCTNVEEKSLKSRVKSALIDLRYCKCGQPWVLKGKADHFIQIYENRWKELVDELGHPSRKLHNISSKIRKGPPRFEVSERKKQKLITPPSD
jgi:hypothetical protein